MPATQASPDQPTAPVVVDGVTLFSVRGVSAYPAEKRAANISAAIAALAADRTVPAESLTVLDGPVASTIEAGGRRIFAVVDADAELEGVSRNVLAQSRVADVGAAGANQPTGVDAEDRDPGLRRS